MTTVNGAIDGAVVSLCTMYTPKQTTLFYIFNHRDCLWGVHWCEWNFGDALPPKAIPGAPLRAPLLQLEVAKLQALVTWRCPDHCHSHITLRSLVYWEHGTLASAKKHHLCIQLAYYKTLSQSLKTYYKVLRSLQKFKKFAIVRFGTVIT